MRFTLIDEADAPPQPALLPGGKRRLEINELLDALTPDVVARVAPAKEEKLTGARGLVFEVAASRGMRVDAWEGEDGLLYVRLLEENEHPTGL